LVAAEASAPGAGGSPARVDHLVWATSDLAAGVEEMSEKLGVALTPGGVHPAWGTRNFLASLGPSTYLEVIGPDPDITEPMDHPWGIATLDRPRLLTWSASGLDLDEACRRAASVGITLGEVREGGREAPDGTVLRWRLTDTSDLPMHGIVPFFIDWGDTPHPAESAVSGGRLIELAAVHPAPERVRAIFEALGIHDVPVTAGPIPGLSARIETPAGMVTIR